MNIPVILSAAIVYEEVWGKTITDSNYNLQYKRLFFSQM